MRVSDDLIADSRRVNRINNRPKRKVLCRNVRRNGERIRFGWRLLPGGDTNRGGERDHNAELKRAKVLTQQHGAKTANQE
jgi:hypothetical protein